MRRLGLIIAAAAAMSIPSPACAALVTYNISGQGTGTMTLDLTGGIYTLNSLNLTLGSATFTQSNSVLVPFGLPYYLLGTTTHNGPGVVTTGYDEFDIWFDPALNLNLLDFTWSNVGASQNFTNGPLNISLAAPAAVPEPSTWMLLLFGFASLGVAMRRKRTLAELA